MSAGCVPVVFSGGGQTEIITDGTNGFLWTTENDWKEKTFSLINNDKLLDKMSQLAKEKSKDFSKKVL